MSYIGNQIAVSNTDSYNKKQQTALFKSNRYELYTENFNVVAGKNFLVDTNSAPITATLPANPNLEDSVEIIDIGGFLSVNNLLILGNGENIMSLAEDLTASDDYSKIRLTYIGLTYGWVLT